MIDHVAPIIRDQHKVLFIQRSASKKTLPSAWSFPTGTQEVGETKEDTVIRECEEELGVSVQPKYVLAVKELPEFDVRLHFVVCDIIGGSPSIEEPEEIQSLEWTTFAEFFNKHSDDEIGHGLVWLRANPKVWRDKFS